MHSNDTNNFSQKTEQATNKNEYRQRICNLNDEFRKTGNGGCLLVTLGIQEMGYLAILTVRELVANYNSFTEDNDPYCEHDFGALTYQGQKIFWKIDYYDVTLTAGSPDPADPAVTTRVLTIMLASEY